MVCQAFFLLGGRTTDVSAQRVGAPGMPATGLLRLESGVPVATHAELAAIGWTIGGSDGGFGRYECVERRDDGKDRVYAGASEVRADGCALAY